MASHDFHQAGNYDSYHDRYDTLQDTSYHSSGGAGTGASRLEQDYPPISNPSNSSMPGKFAQVQAYDSPSSFHTPFDDDRNSYIPPNQSTQNLTRPDSYASSGVHDPFRDSQSIPLQTNLSINHYSKDDGDTSPTTAMGHAEQFAGAGSPTDKRISGDKRGWFKGKIPYAVYLLSAAQLIVFILELVKNGTLTGSPIEIKPTFNPMIGPSPYVLINMGARFVPCMRSYEVPGKGPLTLADIAMPCPNATTLDSECSLAELCGFGMDLTKAANGAQPQPNQWFRFILPIFLHGGIIHIGFNLFLQLVIGNEIEQTIGTIRFCLVYFSAGIFGFVFGGNYSPNGIASTGCSGSLFGIMAILLLDLLYTWKTRKNPGRDLAFLLVEMVVTFVIGLFPGIDNFSHIGGFVTGLVLGICILHSPNALRERIGLDEIPYAAMDLQDDRKQPSTRGFIRKPTSFFKGRKPLWWVWWLLRAGALAAVFAGFIVLITNFYGARTECGWCKHLNCLPIKNWCEIGNLQFTQTTSPAKRGLAIFGLGQSSV